MHWSQYSISTLAPSDPLFPPNLLSIKPKIKNLYYRGTWDPHLFDQTLSIVGSRRSTRYGQQVLEKFLPDLVSAKVTIISGFMYGIDSLAHSLTLSLGGKTIAILGGGLDCLYPPENDTLYQDILSSGGLVISEYEPKFKPTLWSFPQRNRLVSALSTLGVLVIEAGLKSGSLITARLACQQQKPLFAIPGPITSISSSGTNQLIKDHKAILVTSAADILSPSSSLTPTSQPSLFPSLAHPESSIYHLLSMEPLTLDELSLKLNISPQSLSVSLSALSLQNLIDEDNGKFYLKIR